jgi:quinol monooxygenase YgiN
MNEHPVIALVRSKISDPGRPFSIIADLTALPGRGAEVAAAIAKSEAIPLTQAESGCLGYAINQVANEPDHFVAYEQWRDLAALRDHLGTDHFAAVGAALGHLLAGTPTVRILTPLASNAEPKP